MKMLARLVSVSAFALLMSACGGTMEDATLDENIGQSEQEVSCGWGGPPANCLVHCCSHADWSDIGNPGAGNCTAAGNSYCSNKGGNCGSCWGYL